MYSENRRNRRAQRNGQGKEKDSLAIIVDGRTVNVELSPSLVAAIHNDVVKKLFGVSDNELPAHKKKAAHLKRLYGELLQQMQQLYDVVPVRYFSRVRQAAKLAGELELAAQDYRSDFLTRRFDDYASGISWWVPKPLRGLKFVRNVLTNPQSAADRNSNEVIELFCNATVTRLREHLSLPDKSGIMLDRSNIQRFYHPIVDAVWYSQLYKYTSGMKDFLERTLQVGTEGTSEAASLYYRWTSGLFMADESIPLEERVRVLIRGLSFPFHNSKLSVYSSYIDAVRIGIFGVLAALDVEDRRERKSVNLIKRIFRSATNYNSMISETADLANRLLKMYVDPACASEMIKETPVGRRRKTLDHLRKNPGVVALFEQLKESGVSARSYMAFLEHAGDRVAYNGKRQDRYAFVQQLVQGEGRKDAGSWIVQNPDFWDSGGLEMRLRIAADSRSPQLRLGLLRKWSSHRGVQELIVEWARRSDKTLLSLASQLDILPPEVLGRISPENFEPAVAEYHASLSQKSGAAKAPPIDWWIDSIYAQKTELNPLLHSAYGKLSALSAGSRLKLLHDYAAETLPEAEQDAVIRQYALAIQRMPEQLLSTVMGNSSLFSDNKLFEALNAFMSNPEPVDELVRIYNSGDNAHSFLMEWLRAISEPRPIGALEKLVEPEANAPSNVPVRIIVLGNTTSLQGFVAARLNDPAITVVYVNDAQGSTLPPSAPTIVYTFGMKHSGTAYSHLVKGNPIVRQSTGGLTGLVRDIKKLALELRESNPSENP